MVPQRHSRGCGKFFVVVMILWLALSADASATNNAVTVFYFHTTTRCESCLAIEWFTNDILTRTFATELADGRLRWRSVNIDLPENQHFRQDFNLSANELVIEGAGQPAKKLPDVWMLVDTPEKLQRQLLKMVQQALSDQQTLN